MIIPHIRDIFICGILGHYHKWLRHTSFFKKTVDDLRKMCYHKCTAKAVCGYGGIGRRAWFRSMWGQLHAGSTPVIRTNPK